MSADATEPSALEHLTLEQLGARTMTPEELRALAEHLRDLATYLDELRFLQLERRHRLLEGIPNRPTIGYYLQFRRKTA